jgi:hypothetical protein
MRDGRVRKRFSGGLSSELSVCRQDGSSTSFLIGRGGSATLKCDKGVQESWLVAQVVAHADAAPNPAERGCMRMRLAVENIKLTSR